MFKDFNKFINEGHLHTFEDSFVSEFDKTKVNYSNIEDRYEDIDEINVKLEWKIQLEIQKDGIYSFNFSAVKAVIDVRYVTEFGDVDDSYENKIYEIDDAEFENASSFNQVIIKDVDVDFTKGEKPIVVFNMLGAEHLN